MYPHFESDSEKGCLADIEDVKPATKEQRDALEKAMADAGYTFDFEKKELKKNNHWKPSEEQLEALEHFVRSVGESGYASPYDNNTKRLYSLLTDLQVLEKQGEKPQGKSIIEAWKDMRLEVYQQASGNRHEPNCSDDNTKMFSLNDIDEIIEKINEQTDKQD